MSGTKAGGIRAAATNKAKYGKDFYSIQGRKGGLKTGIKGFAIANPCSCTEIVGQHKKAVCAGKKGGKLGHEGKGRRK